MPNFFAKSISFRRPRTTILGAEAISATAEIRGISHRATSETLGHGLGIHFAQRALEIAIRPISFNSRVTLARPGNNYRTLGAEWFCPCRAEQNRRRRPAQLAGKRRRPLFASSAAPSLASADHRTARPVRDTPPPRWITTAGGQLNDYQTRPTSAPDEAVKYTRLCAHKGNRGPRKKQERTETERTEILTNET